MKRGRSQNDQVSTESAEARGTRQPGIIIKSQREIELIRAAGKVVYQILNRLREIAKPGATTRQLNAIAEQMIADVGGTALFKGVRNPQARGPFPAALCTSVNEELVHGIPNDKPLKEGDVLSVDCGVRLSGYCGDSATTIPIGRVSPEAARLIDVTKTSLDVAIKGMRPGRKWSEVAREIQLYVEGEGYSVVRDFVGHGIGRDMHEEPKVPNYWDRKCKDFELVPRMVIAVEPMVNQGTYQTDFGDKDHWVIVTKDRKLAAHFEHTIAITETGVDVLTDGR